MDRRIARAVCRSPVRTPCRPQTTRPAISQCLPLMPTKLSEPISGSTRSASLASAEDALRSATSKAPQRVSIRFIVPNASKSAIITPENRRGRGSESCPALNSNQRFTQGHTHRAPKNKTRSLPGGVQHRQLENARKHPAPQRQIWPQKPAEFAHLLRALPHGRGSIEIARIGSGPSYVRWAFSPSSV